MGSSGFAVTGFLSKIITFVTTLLAFLSGFGGPQETQPALVSSCCLSNPSSDHTAAAETKVSGTAGV